MWTFPSLILVMLLLSSQALAGPNAGGVLMLHVNENLVYSNADCGLSDLDDCTSADVRADGLGYYVVYLFAAFPPEASPRLSGLTVGIDYDPAEILIDRLDWGSCADFVLPDTDWPEPNTGAAFTWHASQTDHLTETAWFVAYCYTEEPTTLTTLDHPGGGALFADDSVPAILDVPIDFGAIGFNTDGHSPCSTAWDATVELTPGVVRVYQTCGESFPVGLRVNDVEDLGRFRVCVGYDDSFLSLAGAAVDESFLGSTGRTVEVADPFSCVSECQAVGIGLEAHTTGIPDGPSGSGPLAEIRFTAVGAGGGEDTICLDDVLLEDTEQPRQPIWIGGTSGIDVTHSPFCFGDFNGDGDVTSFDLAQNIPRWRACVGDPQYNEVYDVNLLEPGNYCASTPDGCIDVVDIQRVASRWHLGCPGGEPAPARISSGTQPTVRIAPESQVVSANAGDPVMVDMMVDDGTDLGAFEAEIAFDPAVLQVSDVEQGDFLQSTGRNLYAFTTQIDNVAGVVRFGTCSVGTTMGAGGGGSLGRIHFEVQDCGTMSDVAIADVMLTNRDGDPQDLAGILDGSITIDCVTDVPATPRPTEPVLFASRPNPASSGAEIAFYIPDALGGPVEVHLAIFDATGRLVRTLANGTREPGDHHVVWDTRFESGDEVPNGTYFSRLRIGEQVLREQMVVAR